MPDRLTKQYYRVGEVAELLGIPVTTLRFWESRFTLVKPRRSSSGHRLYTPSDIEKIETIHFLVKTRGLRLEAAEEEIRRNPRGVSRRAQTLARLRAIRAEVKALYDACSPRAGERITS